MDYSITDNGIRILTADEGFVLTQKYLENEDERIYTGELYLGINDSEDNWIEIINQDD